MCGRYTLSLSRLVGLETALGQPFPVLAPRYNIAPGQSVPAVRAVAGGAYALDMLHWGLLPPWARDIKFGYGTLNARAETVADKPAFRRAFRHRRCLLPADGFYEWQDGAHGKQPWYFTRRDGADFAFAGLWERWEGAGKTIESCSIIVTTANALVGEVHDRMPVILHPGDYRFWLDPGVTAVAALEALLAPYPDADMTVRPVSRAVNSARAEGPELIAPQMSR